MTSTQIEYNNIDCFNISVACILSDLHSAFPRPLTIMSHTYQQTLAETNRLPKSCDWRNGAPAEGNLISATLNYLIDEGLIRCPEGVTSGFLYENLVLTSKGLTVLNQPIDSLANKKSTIGDALRAMPDHATKSVIGSAVATIFKIISN